MTPFSRRDLLRGAGAALASAACGAGAQGAKQRPNIILVLLDDLGYGQFGPNSDMFDLQQLNPMVADRDKAEIKPEAAVEAAKMASTNLTRLATEGTRFTDAYVACPLCAPSRSAIMTARYPQRFGGYINRDIEKGGVPLDQIFPAQLLQKSGYRTAVIGKWHLAKMQGGMDPAGGQHPLDRGFDYFFGFNSCCSTYYDATNLWRNREKAKPEGYITDQFTDEAIRFLRGGPAGHDKPFFLYLPYNAVHGPYGKPAPDKYLSRFHTGSKRIDNFYAYLQAADEGVGRIRQVLAEQGQEKNTLIFLLSDNGASGSSPIPSNAPFLGFKGQVWQGGVRVPMVAWGAGQAGKISREPVISMDVMATALSAAGVNLPVGYTLDGRNLLPVLRGEQKKPLHESLFWAGQLAQKWVHNESGAGDEMTAPPAWAVRKGRWMLRYWSHIQRHELYDLETDRGERQEVGAQHSKVVSDLKAEYAQWYGGTKKPMAWEEQYWKVLAP
jgi:uncharacterized sulfatase